MYAGLRSFVCAHIYVVVAVLITPLQKGMGAIGCKSGCITMLVDGSCYLSDACETEFKRQMSGLLHSLRFGGQTNRTK